jgi:phosphoglycerate kinase
MQAELEALDAALGNPVRPVAAIVGGAKVSTKLELLGNLVDKVNVLIIGGAMANTFLSAQGKGVGKSLQEAEMHGTALEILTKAQSAGCRIVLPTDAVVARELKPNTPVETVSVDAVPADMMILDIGPASVASLIQLLASVKTLSGTVRSGLRNAAVRCRHTPLAHACRGYAEFGLRSVAGGGDTVSALAAPA